MTKLLLLIVVLLLSFAVAAQDSEFETFENFTAYLDTIAEAENAQELADELMTRLEENQDVPFIRGENVAFLYQGRAATVDWRGDFSGWIVDYAVIGEQVGETDLWVGKATFPTDARLEYKIVVNDSWWQLDPANPMQQMGGFGANSEFRMPDYVPSEYIAVRDDIEKGTIGELQRITSENLEYDVNYEIYYPAGWQNMESLPVAYVTDGHEYADPDMGRMITVTDNLIADGLIEPLLIVFIDPRKPDAKNINRRDIEYLENPKFAAFVAEELVPVIDAELPTDASADGRMILGTSFGGVASTYIAFTYPDVFHKVGIQSPAYWALSDDLRNGYMESEDLPLDFFVTNGLPLWDSQGALAFVDVLKEKGYPHEYVQISEGHSWGNWRSLLDDLLIYFFGT